MCPDLADMFEHQGSLSLSIPCSSFHPHLARRAAEATMVLSGAKILPILQLEFTADRITMMHHPQRSWELPRFAVVPCRPHRRDFCSWICPLSFEPSWKLPHCWRDRLSTLQEERLPPAPLSLPPSASAALLQRLALSTDKVAPTVSRSVPAAGKRHGALWQAFAGPDPAPSHPLWLFDVLTGCLVRTSASVPTWVAGAAGMGRGLTKGIEKGSVLSVS